MDLIKACGTGVQSRVLCAGCWDGRMWDSLSETMKAETLTSNIQIILFAIQKKKNPKVRTEKLEVLLVIMTAGNTRHFFSIT